ncbi:unknown protein [Oryza sativa Japonica Group]|uniref:Os01g0186600 protein n=5 Tax=Oryza TaxID=4527 RepID=A0A0P0UZ72_ORYSJ|nr:uncharacterized protein LOC4325660 [Oryza sativa Japonica Group]EAY72830.1 hypothetical protein OsI_00696 [Oryza sativa Indica Group]KAB8080281.1 hypothetical protein EE612_000709 [Oryza sativa]KAF2948822.1 hypothetical protein DAI22_01g063000 [Oryza sativa Japonica Group]BAD67807.1 unknown protein [Oryza sativa Japonica Group]BAD72246.1 unknown protein [Oryza sativa Japonica Group]|eukprot:NP_001042245.2 Os01g0186600 [Oryza sativa Japonica Group]
MDMISGMLRPAFDRITPSIASAAVFSFSRVVSFTGSFNSRTGLLTAADGEEETPLSPQAIETTASTGGVGAFDIEAPAAMTTTPDQAVLRDDVRGDDELIRRLSKSVQPVCLFCAAASLTMSVNLPASGGAGGALYGATLAFVCLGLFASLGLSMYTIVSRPGDAAVARVQKWAMVLALAFVLVSFTLRMWPVLVSSSSSPAPPPRST